MGSRHALLIATSRYLDPKLRTLDVPVTEAERLRALLLDQDVGHFDTATLVADESKSEIERRIEELYRARRPEDLVLLYIAGHGLKNDHDKLFFAACNTDATRPHSTAVPATFVQGLMEESQAGVKAVLLDCCFGGAFSNGLVARSTNPVEFDQLLGRGTYVITATTEIEYAWEGDSLVLGVDSATEHSSVFTSALIRGLESGDADTDKDGLITGDELYSYVYQQAGAANVRQTPTRHDRIKGDFYFAYNRANRQGTVTGDTAGSPTLGTLLRQTEQGGAPPGQRLTTPIGHAYQTGKDPVPTLVDLTEQNIVVIGRLRSGKSTLLLTTIIGLAHTHTPDEVRFFCLDADGRLNLLAELAHVSSIVTDDDHNAVNEVLTHLEKLITARRELCRREHIHGMGTFRKRRAEGTLPPGRHADVCLVIDNWDRFAGGRPDFVESVRRIATQGPGLGIRVIVTALHRDQVPTDIRRLLLGRVELQLDDPAESLIDPARSAELPDTQGWGLVGRQQFRVALPRPDDTNSDYGLEDMVRQMVWAHPTAAEELTRHAPAAEPSFTELLAIGDPTTFDPEVAWRPRPPRERLRVPFGLGAFGEPVELDLKEAAREGMGPHGLCIGATGSGKSEFLRTLVLGLASTHSPAALNMVLADFKGGATFLGLERLPHVSAVVTNLAEDLTLVDRMSDAIAGELVRRQEILRGAGNYKNVWDYQQARERGAELEPLPALLICIDEFSELLTAKPSLVDLFVQIGRVGRSLHVHLLLASQRLEEGRLRGLDTYLSYRIGLKTFSAAESRAAIGVPDAYELPPVPGTGYLKFDTASLVRFKAAYVSGPVREADGPPDAIGTGQHNWSPSLLDALVDRMVGHGTPAHQVWLPPLDEPWSLDTHLPPLSPTVDRGLSAVGFFGNGTLRVPLGLVDKPFEQRRDLLWADFSGAAGHGAVVGAPQSGKSTMLRTLIMSTALTHTPEQVQFYCVDLGGGTLASMQGLPHVGGVAGRLDPDKVRRMVAELAALVAAREERFNRLGIDSMAEFRARKDRGELPEDRFGDVFLVIDGWFNFRHEFEAIELQVVNLAAQGLSYGIHVVLAANRWAEIRPSIKDLLGTRLELRLGDTSESEIDRRVAATVPAERPGRGLTRDKLHFLTALPRIDGVGAVEGLAAAVEDAVGAVSAAWPGRRAQPVRLLPTRIERGDLPPAPGRQIVLGIDEDDLAPVHLDLEAESHFVAFMDGESGKTNLLRTIVRGIMGGYSTKEAVIILVDYRRTMLGYIGTDHLLGYAVSANQLNGMMSDVVPSMRKRMPGPDVTQEQLRDRSWWNGPELFVVVDDYDLVAPSGGAANPLQPLAEFLPQAKDLGLHLIIARRTGGAARALYDPVLGRLKELASPGLVGNGQRDEGNLLGAARPSAFPPGRGILVSRRAGQQLIQVAWTAPNDPNPPESRLSDVAG